MMTGAADELTLASKIFNLSRFDGSHDRRTACTLQACGARGRFGRSALGSIIPLLSLNSPGSGQPSSASRSAQPSCTRV